jgi:hypothetical protein
MARFQCPQRGRERTVYGTENFKWMMLEVIND